MEMRSNSRSSFLIAALRPKPPASCRQYNDRALQNSDKQSRARQEGGPGQSHPASQMKQGFAKISCACNDVCVSFVRKPYVSRQRTRATMGMMRRTRSDYEKRMCEGRGDWRYESRNSLADANRTL